jgi:RNA polymerase sigma-70 factor (ECF subfamily)
METAELTSLYERYGALVHRRCVALMHNAVDADDALQEVFMRVQKYGRPEATGSDLGWLYAIATRVCFDLQARKKEAPLDPHELPALDVRSQGGARDADVRAVVGVALREMDAKTAEIGVLHHLDGFTQEEVAARTGISRKTIGRKLAVFEALVRDVFTRAAQLKGVAR